MAVAPPETIRDATEKVLASDEYRLDLEEHALNPLWQRLLEMLRSVLEFIAKLFSFLDGLPQLLRWIIICALLVMLVLLIWHIIYSIMSAMGTAGHRRAKLRELLEHRDDPRLWEQQSEQLAETGSFVEASRLLLRASLFRLEDFFDRPFRRATTNREYLRKYRQLPVLDAVRQLVETIDRKWYGEEPCDRQDYEECRESHSRILELVRQRPVKEQKSA